MSASSPSAYPAASAPHISNANHSVRTETLTRPAATQRRTIQIFHDNEGLPVFFVNFMDGADVRMIQGGCRFGLALKSA
jgi:hypothetical protein